MDNKQDILQLQRTVRFFEALLRASADGIVITDMAKNIIFVNDTFCEYFSRKYQEVIETNIFVWLEMQNRNAQDIWYGMESQIKEHGMARDVEFRMKIKEDIRYFSVDASPLEKVDIEEAGLIISIWRDDTQRKVAENDLKSAHNELEMRVKERTIQLQESEGKYRRLFEYSNDIIVYVNLFGKVLAVNNKVEEILGFKPQEVIGKHFIHLGILGISDLPRIYELFKKTVRKGMTRDDTGRLLDKVEIELRTRSGNSILTETSTTVVKKDGKTEGFLTTIRDITERSRMEKDLKISEEKYRTLYETMAQGVVYHDADGKIISVNPAAQNILGLSINHLIGRTSIDPAWKAIHEDGTSFPEQKHPSMMALRTRKKVSHVIMGVFNPVEKKYRWIMVNAVPQIRYAQTKPYQVYSTFDDITNIKQAEEEIQAANMELMTMNRLITTTTGILDIDRILETVLDESMKIVGFEGGSICLLNQDETLQLTVHRGLPEAAVIDLKTNKVKVGECLCGESARVMKPLILPDPEAVKKSNTREALFDKNIRYHAAFPIVTSGKCVGVLCVFTCTDKKLSGKSLKFLETITAQVALSIDNARLYQEGKDYVEKLEKKVMERTFALQENQMSLLNLVDDMNRTTSELENANKRLLELDRMKSMFIASTSHELRTPLNSIIGFTSILLEGWSGELAPEQKEQIQIVNNSGKHLLSLINDVIDISKAEAGKLEVHVSRFNLKEVIDEVVTSLKPELNVKGLLLHVEADDMDLITDRKRLLQCLINLLSNAVKFTEKGEIKVRAKSINNEIEISIEDTGIGMKKEDIPKIFNAFVRLDSPLTNKTSGTGLGLYLTQKLAKEVLLGTIKVKSEYGRGSIFSMQIPQEVKV